MTFPARIDSRIDVSAKVLLQNSLWVPGKKSILIKTKPILIKKQPILMKNTVNPDKTFSACRIDF